MIVRPRGDVLQLITQPDHARLAGEIMRHSAALASHTRRASILRAVAEHDNGWAEPDAAPMIDPASGTPLDFVSAPIAVRQGVWPRGVSRLAHDPWAAGLVAQHALAIFERYRADSAWTRFFTEMEALRQAMLAASRWSLAELLDDYRFVGLGDVISLTFCNGWTDVQTFETWSVRLSASQVVVSPDLFDGKTIAIAIEARDLGRRAFHSDADLRNELSAAPTVRVEGEVTSSLP